MLYPQVNALPCPAHSTIPDKRHACKRRLSNNRVCCGSADPRDDVDGGQTLYKNII